MKSKKGISLIVLVITIIVIIILAAAVLLSISKNNPMDSARTATYENDKAEVRSAVALYVSNFVAKDYYHKSPFEAGTVIEVGVSGGTKVKNSTVTPTTTAPAEGAANPASSNTYTKVVSWEDLGLTGEATPQSIYTCKYDVDSGLFTFIPAAEYKATSGKEVTEDTDGEGP